jgi:predicted Zn-dependent peptidase
VRIGAVVRAALGAALVLSAAGAGPAAPATGMLPGGGTYVLRPSAGAPVAAIALWYRAPSAGFGATPVPGLSRLAASAVSASTPITGTPLATFARQVGGRLTVATYPDSVAVSLLVPSARAADAVRALTRSYFAPVLTDAGLARARQDLLEDGQLRSFNHDAPIVEALYASLFAAGPDKVPAFASTGPIADVTLDGLRAFAERAFRPTNAVLVAAGDVDMSAISAALPGRDGAQPGVEPASPNVVANPPAPVQTAGPEGGFGRAWAGPPIADENAATAFDFIADYLFFPDTGIVQREMRDSGAVLVGTFVTYHDPGIFIVSSSGGDQAAVQTAVDAALRTIRLPLDAATFEAARQRFLYHILSDAATPSTLADTFGWYTVEGNAAYAPGEGGMTGHYLTAVMGLTPASVAAAAAKYLDQPGAAVTVAPASAPGAK